MARAKDRRQQIAFYGDAEYRKRLKQVALDRGDISVQQLLEEAVELLLSTGTNPALEKKVPSVDETITPQGTRERQLVKGFLACIRDKKFTNQSHFFEKLLQAWMKPSSHQ